jgi:hypothetical protein
MRSAGSRHVTPAETVIEKIDGQSSSIHGRFHEQPIDDDYTLMNMSSLDLN